VGFDQLIRDGVSPFINHAPALSFPGLPACPRFVFHVLSDGLGERVEEHDRAAGAGGVHPGGDGPPRIIGDLPGAQDDPTEGHDGLVRRLLDARSPQRVVELVEAEIVPEATQPLPGRRPVGPQLRQDGHALRHQQLALRLTMCALQRTDDGVAANRVEL